MADDNQGGTMQAAKEAARQALVPSIVGATTEIAPTAGAAQVQAMVQARFIMALKQPRNMDKVRQDLLKECSRPDFALEEKEGEGNSALYRRPVGGGAVAEGLGIRFAEVAVRCMTNVMAGALTVAEDDFKKTKYCFVIDFETNASWEDTIDISKTVERATPRQGDEVLKQRINSRGVPVYTIVANEDALATKEAAAISKKLRTLVLRLVPGDFQDECIRKIKEIRQKRIMDDPDAAKKRIIDGMALQNVTVTMLEEYLSHPVGQCTPAEIMNLQGLYGALRDGLTTWRDVMENIDESRKVKPKAPETQAAAQAPTQPAADKGMEAAKAAAQPTQPAAAAPVQPAPTQPAPAAPVPQTPVPQPAPQPTAAEIPAQPQQTEPTLAQVPASQPAPQPAPAEPAAPAGAPSWAADTAPEPAAAPAQPEPQPPQAAPPQSVGAGWTDEGGVAVLSGPLKGGKGKVIKDVQFPAIMTRDNDGEAWTPDQLARAQTAMDKVNVALGGKNFKLDSSIKNWFGSDMNQLSGQAMECVIRVLENWK